MSGVMVSIICRISAFNLPFLVLDPVPKNIPLYCIIIHPFRKHPCDDSRPRANDDDCSAKTPVSQSFIDSTCCFFVIILTFIRFLVYMNVVP